MRSAPASRTRCASTTSRARSSASTSPISSPSRRSARGRPRDRRHARHAQGARDQDCRRDRAARPRRRGGRRGLRADLPHPAARGARARGRGRRPAPALRARLRAGRGHQRRLRRPLQPAPARLLRPPAAPRRPGLLRHHPLVHGLPHVLLPHVQRGRGQPVPARRLQAVPRVARRGDRARAPGGDDRPDRRRVADGRGVGLPQRGSVLRPAVRPRPGGRALRGADDQPPALARSSGGHRGGHGLRARDLLRSQRRALGGPHRGGGRGHRRRRRHPHEVPGRGAPGDRQGLRTRRRPPGRLRGAAADLMTEPTTVSRDTPGTPEEAEHYLELYRRMRLIRRFEDEVQSLFQQGLVHGTTHLCSGQEAGPVGVCSVLGDEDRVAGTYRGHGHALALGVEPEALMAELLGRATGVCAGRAGSMNVIDLEHRLVGCYGIVGGSIAAATGVALALKRRGGVAVAFFGDGAPQQGYFPQCLNFAQVHRLPAVYVCENNLYRGVTPIEGGTAGGGPPRARTLGLPTATIDGNDVWTVSATAAEAVRRAREGGGPQFVESLTYRYVGHSRSDPGKYRKPGELDEWKLRDPLLVARAGLAERYGTTEEALEAVDAQVEENLAQVIEAAKAAPFPDPEAPVTEFKA